MDGGIGGGVEGSCSMSWCPSFCCVLADANITWRRLLCQAVYAVYAEVTSNFWCDSSS